MDGNWTYSYDAIGELTHAVFASTNPAVAGQDLAYFYDAAGNRTKTIINGVTTIYTTNNMNEYAQVGDAQYGYDADGNMSWAMDVASGDPTMGCATMPRTGSRKGGVWAVRGGTSTTFSATAWQRRRAG